MNNVTSCHQGSLTTKSHIFFSNLVSLVLTSTVKRFNQNKGKALGEEVNPNFGLNCTWQRDTLTLLLTCAHSWTDVHFASFCYKIFSLSPTLPSFFLLPFVPQFFSLPCIKSPQRSVRLSCFLISIAVQNTKILFLLPAQVFNADCHTHTSQLHWLSVSHSHTPLNDFFVWERETERERERGVGSALSAETHTHTHASC